MVSASPTAALAVNAPSSWPFSTVSQFHPLTNICRFYGSCVISIKKAVQIVGWTKYLPLGVQFVDRNSGSVIGYIPYGERRNSILLVNEGRDFQFEHKTTIVYPLNLVRCESWQSLFVSKCENSINLSSSNRDPSGLHLLKPSNTSHSPHRTSESLMPRYHSYHFTPASWMIVHKNNYQKHL